MVLYIGSLLFVVYNKAFVSLNFDFGAHLFLFLFCYFFFLAHSKRWIFLRSQHYQQANINYVCNFPLDARRRSLLLLLWLCVYCSFLILFVGSVLVYMAFGIYVGRTLFAGRHIYAQCTVAARRRFAHLSKPRTLFLFFFFTCFSCAEILSLIKSNSLRHDDKL